MTKNEFIAYLAPYAIQLRIEGSPMFPSVRIAQNLLETGGVIHSWFNLGGIKVGSGKPNEWWDGSSVKKGTWEVVNGVRVDTSANFRAYRSVYHFYKDQDLLFGTARYSRVRFAKTPEEQAKSLYLCGYATDPQYADKLLTIIKAYGLMKYDEEAAREMQKIEELEKRIKALEAKVDAPKWFIEEFGDPSKLVGANGKPLINDPQLTAEGWRQLTYMLRYTSNSKK